MTITESMKLKPNKTISQNVLYLNKYYLYRMGYENKRKHSVLVFAAIYSILYHYYIFADNVIWPFILLHNAIRVDM